MTIVHQVVYACDSSSAVAFAPSAAASPPLMLDWGSAAASLLLLRLNSTAFAESASQSEHAAHRPMLVASKV